MAWPTGIAERDGRVLRRSGRWCVLVVAGLVGIAVGAGCAGSGGSRERPVVAARDRVAAEELCDRAEPLMESNPAKAEELLQQAVLADSYSGRARNNLGVVFLESGRLHAAAVEFELARKLMPEHPDPRINLGVTLERAGRGDEAIGAYEGAHEMNPEHVGAMQALARAQLRFGRTDSRTRELLGEIALRGDEAWRRWAIQQSARMDGEVGG